MFKVLQIAILILLVFLSYYLFFQKKDVLPKIEHFRDTIRVIDTLFIPLKNNAKIFARQDTTTRRAVDSLIKLQKDSIEQLLEFVLFPVDTTFYFEPKGSVRINYQPINRYLFTEVVLPKIIEKTTIKDSVIVEVQKNDIKELAIAGAVGFVVGVLLLVIH